MKKKMYVSPQLKVVEFKVETGYNGSDPSMRNMELDAPQSLQPYQNAGETQGWYNSFN